MKFNFSWVLMVSACMLFFMVLPAISYCQIGDPLGDPDAPIDGGVGVLIAAGIGYGFKKARDSRKKASGQGL